MGKSLDKDQTVWEDTRMELATNTPDYLAPIVAMELRDDLKEYFGSLRTSHRDGELYLDWFYGLAYPNHRSEDQ